MRREQHALARGHGGLEAGLAGEREVARAGAAGIAIGKGEMDADATRAPARCDRRCRPSPRGRALAESLEMAKWPLVWAPMVTSGSAAMRPDLVPIHQVSSRQSARHVDVVAVGERAHDAGAASPRRSGAATNRSPHRRESSRRPSLSAGCHSAPLRQSSISSARATISSSASHHSSPVPSG